MSTQLRKFVSSQGAAIRVGHRAFTVEGFSGDGDRVLATFKANRARYTGGIAVNAKVPSKPGAEVWFIIAGKRTLCRFAVYNGAIVPLA